MQKNIPKNWQPSQKFSNNSTAIIAIIRISAVTEPQDYKVPRHPVGSDETVNHIKWQKNYSFINIY